MQVYYFFKFIYNKRDSDHADQYAYYSKNDFKTFHATTINILIRPLYDKNYRITIFHKPQIQIKFPHALTNTKLINAQCYGTSA